MREHNCEQITNKRKSKYPYDYPKIVLEDDGDYKGDWVLEVDGAGDWDCVVETITFCPFCGAVLSREGEDENS